MISSYSYITVPTTKTTILSRMIDTLCKPRTLLLLALIFLMLLPILAQAQAANNSGLLPTTGVSIPGTTDSDSWVKKFGYIIRLGIFLICMGAVGFGMSDSIFGIFRTINDARNNGEWGPAIKQILLILLGVVIALVLFAVLNNVVFSAIEKFLA